MTYNFHAIVVRGIEGVALIHLTDESGAAILDHIRELTVEVWLNKISYNSSAAKAPGAYFIFGTAVCTDDHYIGYKYVSIAQRPVPELALTPVNEGQQLLDAIRNLVEVN